ncbi:unnamed protein product [Closterium sp. NIES-65]|nr:unnamed protein product [Closterium sp. NIES-65]
MVVLHPDDLLGSAGSPFRTRVMHYDPKSGVSSQVGRKDVGSGQLVSYFWGKLVENWEFVLSVQSGRPFPGLGKGTYSKEEILAWLITTCRDNFGGHADALVADLVELDNDAESDSTCDLASGEDQEEEEAAEAHADTGVRAPSTLLPTWKLRMRHTQSGPSNVSLLTMGGTSDPVQSSGAGTKHVNDAECGFMKGALQEAERLRVQRRRQAEGSSQEVQLGEHAAARMMAGSNVEREIEPRNQGGESSAKKLKKLPDDDRRGGPPEIAAVTDASRERGEMVGVDVDALQRSLKPFIKQYVEELIMRAELKQVADTTEHQRQFAKTLKEEIMAAVHRKRNTGREVEIGGASMLHSPPAKATVVLEAQPSIPDAAPSTPLQHTNIHGMNLGVTTDVEAVDKEVKKGGEDGEPETGVGKGKVREGAKVVKGGPVVHTGLEGAAEGVGEDVQTVEKVGEYDEVEEKEHGSSDGKEAEMVEESSGEKKNADMVVQLADMEAEEKCLAAKEEEERTRAAERMRALASERARLSAARLRLMQQREPDVHGAGKPAMETSGEDRLRQVAEHSEGTRGVKRRRDGEADQSESETGVDEAIASDGDENGANKKGKACVVADGLGKVYGEDKPYKAGGFFKRKKATAGGKYCSEQTAGGCKRNLGNFDSERNRNFSIDICWMAYTPDADLLFYGMDKEDVQAWSAHLNLAKQLPTGVWSVIHELHISRIEK